MLVFKYNLYTIIPASRCAGVGGWKTEGKFINTYIGKLHSRIISHLWSFYKLLISNVGIHWINHTVMRYKQFFHTFLMSSICISLTGLFDSWRQDCEMLCRVNLGTGLNRVKLVFIGHWRDCKIFNFCPSKVHWFTILISKVISSAFVYLISQLWNHVISWHLFIKPHMA